MKETNEDQIQIALQPAPMDYAPSEDLMRKLRVMAHETKPRQRLAWLRYALPASATGLVATAAVVLMTSAPSKASALDLIMKATNQANSFQFSVMSDEKDKHEFFTIAGADGHIYMHSDEGAMMEITPGTMSVYDKGERTITRLKFGNNQDMAEIAKQVQSGIAEGMKEINLKSMLQEYKAKYGTQGMKVSPIAVEDGERVYHVTLSSNNDPERVEIKVNAASDLPEKLEVSSNGKTTVKMEMKFGNDVDQKLLRVDFPKDAKVEEIDLGSIANEAMKGLKNLGDEMDKSSKK